MPPHATVDLIYRRIPPQFRGPAFTHTRNNVYEWITKEDGQRARRLVGQLEEVHTMQVPQASVRGLLGGSKALQVLQTAGSVASIVNLGVSLVGFGLVRRDLKRLGKRMEAIEGRLANVEAKQDQTLESLELLHTKVDYLADLSEAQLRQLRAVAETTDAIHRLQKAQVTSKLMGALKTLEILEGLPRRDRDRMVVLQAAQQLTDHSELLLALAEGLTWDRDAVALSELLVTFSATVLAEAKARALVGHDSHAVEVLRSGTESIRVALRRAVDADKYWWGLPISERASVWAWVQGRDEEVVMEELAQDTDGSLKAVMSFTTAMYERMRLFHGRADKVKIEGGRFVVIGSEHLDVAFRMAKEVAEQPPGPPPGTLLRACRAGQLLDGAGLGLGVRRLLQSMDDGFGMEPGLADAGTIEVRLRSTG